MECLRSVAAPSFGAILHHVHEKRQDGIHAYEKAPAGRQSPIVRGSNRNADYVTEPEISEHPLKPALFPGSNGSIRSSYDAVVQLPLESMLHHVFGFVMHPDPPHMRLF